MSTEQTIIETKKKITLNTDQRQQNRDSEKPNLLRFKESKGVELI